MREIVPSGTSTASQQTEAAAMPDPQAVRLAQQGDRAAFEQLYRKHSPRVYSLCLRMTGNSAEAEDLTQEAFLQVFRKIQTFRGESAFSTWLHRLAVNIVLMRLRKKTVGQTSPEDVLGDEEFGKAQMEFGSPDLALGGSIDRVCLKRAVAQLPRGYKQIFVLHDVQGYEHREIAAILGCSIGNSKSQLHKARTRLREFIRESARERQRQERVSSRACVGRQVVDLCSSPG
jgi:RNA polymerase sigma-70 factor (ECF subfamily)